MKPCAHCGKPFNPWRMGQRVCGPVCAGRWVKVQKKVEEKAEREDVKRRKAALMTAKELIPLVQDDFNAFIRERDKDKGCFVCDKPFPSTNTLGGVMDAGHVRSRGAAGHLRFNEDNCHGECKSCNSSFGAKPHEIEAGAIRRIGQERYDALKNDNTPRKFLKVELLELRAIYKAKLKQLKDAE